MNHNVASSTAAAASATPTADARNAWANVASPDESRHVHANVALTGNGDAVQSRRRSSGGSARSVVPNNYYTLGDSAAATNEDSADLKKSAVFPTAPKPHICRCCHENQIAVTSACGHRLYCRECGKASLLEMFACPVCAVISSRITIDDEPEAMVVIGGVLQPEPEVDHTSSCRSCCRLPSRQCAGRGESCFVSYVAVGYFLCCFPCILHMVWFEETD